METTKINKILHAYKVSALAAMAHATNDIKPRKLRLLDNTQSYPSTYKRVISEALSIIVSSFSSENENVTASFAYRVNNNNEGIIRLDSPYTVNTDFILSAKSKLRIPVFDPEFGCIKTHKKDTLFFKRMMYLSFFNLMLLKYLSDEEFANLDAANNPNFPIEKILEIHNEKFSHLELPNELIKAFCVMYRFKDKSECRGLSFDYMEPYIVDSAPIIDIDTMVSMQNISTGRNGKSFLFDDTHNINNELFGRHSTVTCFVQTNMAQKYLLTYRGVFPKYTGNSSMTDFYLSDEVTSQINKSAYKKLIPININDDNSGISEMYYPAWMPKDEYIKESFYASDVINYIGEEGNEDYDIAFRRVSLFNNLFYILTKYMESSFNSLCRIYSSVVSEYPNKTIMMVPLIASKTNGSGKLSSNSGEDSIFNLGRLSYSRRLDRIPLNFTLSDMINPAIIKEKLNTFRSTLSTNISNNRD